MDIGEIRVGGRYGKESGNGEAIVRKVTKRGLEPTGYRWVEYEEEGKKHEGRGGRIPVSRFARWAEFEVK